MSRLVLLLGPIASALTGIALAHGLELSFKQLASNVLPFLAETNQDEGNAVSETEGKNTTKSKGKVKTKGKAKKSTGVDPWAGNQGSAADLADDQQTTVKKAGAFIFLWIVLFQGQSFYAYCQRMGLAMSNPSLMWKAQLNDGTSVMIDDYREAYWWLRDNTADDARVMAWWDYGYQITGIANRTSIADGNTWNHEHIATLGRCLTSSEKEAHKLIRHLADYVLIWTGGGGDDLAKSPHMARIGTSVYDDICPGDPTCAKYGFVDDKQTPTAMMAASLLYKLHGHGQTPGVTVDPDRFAEVYTSKYNKVRIYKVLHVSKKSRRWAADPANRKCDAPGSWYCDGQYSPAFKKLLTKRGRKAFAQLEDFNTQKDEKSKEHYKEYMKKMAGEK